VVDLKEREPQYRALTKRVLAKRASARLGEPVLATGASTAPALRGKPAPAPRPGARPTARPAKRRP